MKKLIFIILILLAQMSFGQVSFEGNADYTSVPAGQSFNVTYSLKGADPDAFNRPSFSGFRILGQQSFSGSGGMRIVVNNQVVRDDSGENKWIFILRALNPGTYTIEPAKVKCDGKTYSSNSIKIKVTNGGNAVGSNNTQSSKSKAQKNQSSGGKDVFLKVIPQKNTAYIGEAVIATYRIYTKVDITQYGISKTPAMDGFWMEEMADMSKNAKTWEEVIDGERYMVGEIRKIALYPQKAGVLKVPSLEVEAILRIASKMQMDPFSMFDQFFQNPFGSDPFSQVSVRTEKRTLRSNPFSINVKNLPESNKPVGFNGAVGDFDVTAEVDRNVCTTGDGITLSVNVSGNGNLMLLDAPSLELPLGFQQYDPEVVDNFTKVASGISGSRKFDFLIVPENQGEFTLGPWVYSWFNPQTGTYSEKEIPAIKIKVEKGSGTLKKRSDNIESDIRYILEKIPSSMSKSATFAFSPLFWILFSLAWLIFILIMYFLRKQLKLKNNVQEFKNHFAVRVAKHRLKKAAAYMSKNNETMFYQELSHALWLYITDKFALPVSELSMNTVKDVLMKNSIPENIVTPFMDILNACEVARFTPLNNNASMQDLYNSASNLIMDIQTKVKL